LAYFAKANHVNLAAWTDESHGLSLDRALLRSFFGSDFAVLWLQLLFDKFKFLSLLGVIESVGADLLEAPGQDVLQEPMHELLGPKRLGLCGIRLPITIPEGDVTICHVQDGGKRGPSISVSLAPTQGFQQDFTLF